MIEHHASSSVLDNPHLSRITNEHSYLFFPSLLPKAGVSTAMHAPKPKRHLPSWLTCSADQPHASREVHKAFPDKVFDYAFAVLNDGLLLLEFRDAIHEGDGPRIARCWKFLILYYWCVGHTKCALEVFYFRFLLNGTASTRIAKQLLWGRVVSTRGGKGHNLPADLHMEHLNRCVKDYIMGLGANAREETITQVSKSVNRIMSVFENFEHRVRKNKTSLSPTPREALRKMRRWCLKSLQNALVLLTMFLDGSTPRFPTFNHTLPELLTLRNYSSGLRNTRKRQHPIQNMYSIGDYIIK